MSAGGERRFSRAAHRAERTRRPARHLLDLASHEVRASRGTSRTLMVHVSQREIAEAVGTVREVVVRVLRDLREEEIISTHRDHIDILDPIRLSRERGGTSVADERPP